MITRYRVSLDGVNLDALAPEIMIIDVGYTQPGFTLLSGTLAGRSGQIVMGQTLNQNGVTVTVEIHTQSIARRQEVLNLMQRWAMGGGMLKVNSRPHHHMRVSCERPPAIPSELKWTGKITIGFAAYGIPYWIEDETRKVTVAGNASGTIRSVGAAKETPVAAEITNTSGETVDTLTVTAGETVFSFAQLGLEAGKTLSIGEDERGLLYIRAGDESKMDKRTPESSDELKIRQNEQATVSVAANAAVKAVFYVRGRDM